MTNLTAREVVEKLHQYDDLPSFPKVNIHFLATAPGNEHLLKFMTEKPDNPIRFKGKRIGIIATHVCGRWIKQDRVLPARRTLRPPRAQVFPVTEIMASLRGPAILGLT